MQDDFAKSLPADFVHSLIEMANQNNEEMTGSMDEVRQIISDNELVFAVWQDASKPYGVGLLIVKGNDLFRNCIASGTPIEVRVSAISCVEYEGAVALIRACGEPDRRN